jgi:uncharacterized protein (TIGR00369 family)
MKRLAVSQTLDSTIIYVTTKRDRQSYFLSLSQLHGTSVAPVSNNIFSAQQSITPEFTAMNAIQLVRQVTALTGFTQSAGVEVNYAEPGKVELELARKPELLQFNGYFHGGVVSGLADHAAGAAATTALASGKIAITVDLHVNFLSPASGNSIVAKAHTLQVGGTSSRQCCPTGSGHASTQYSQDLGSLSAVQRRLTVRSTASRTTAQDRCRPFTVCSWEP